MPTLLPSSLPAPLPTVDTDMSSDEDVAAKLSPATATGATATGKAGKSTKKKATTVKKKTAAATKKKTAKAPKTPSAKKATASGAPVTTEKKSTSKPSPPPTAKPAPITSFFCGGKVGKTDLFKSAAVPKKAEVAKPAAKVAAVATKVAAVATKKKPWQEPKPEKKKEVLEAKPAAAEKIEEMEEEKEEEEEEKKKKKKKKKKEEAKPKPMEVDEELDEELDPFALVESAAAPAAPAAAPAASPKKSPKKAAKKPTIPLDDAKISSYTSKRDAYLTTLNALSAPTPTPPLPLPPAASFARDETNPNRLPLPALTFFAAHIEGATAPLPTLTAAIENMLLPLDDGSPLTTEEVSETILSLAARKALGVPPAKGVASTTDVASEHSWVWEVTILDILPLDFVTRAVKPVRAARRKLSVRVKATHRVTEVCRKTPGDADKINGEEEKVLKYEREDEAVRLKEELKEEEKLKKFQSKLAESKLKEETKGAKLAVKEQQKVENDAMKAEEKSIRDVAKEEKKAQAIAEKLANKSEAELKKEEEDRVLKEKRKADKEAKEAQRAKQSSMMMGFFSKKAPEKLAATAASATAVAAKPAQFASVWESVNTGTGDAPAFLKKNGRTKRSATGEWVKVSVMATVFPPGGDDPFSMAGAPYSEPREVTLFNRKKFLCFDEDVRPAYCGTWSKRSRAATGRRPFGKERRFDYEYDSEAEWEEGDEEGGEDVGDEDADAKDKQEDNEEANYDYADGWMRDDDDYGSDEEDGGMRAIRKEVGSAIESSLGTEKVIVSCNFGGIPKSEYSEGNPVVIMQTDVKLLLCAFAPKGSKMAKEKVGNTPKEIAEELMPEFVEFITNSNIPSKDKLVDEFLKREFVGDAPSKARTLKKLEEIAEKVKIDGASVYRIKGTTAAPTAATGGSEEKKIAGFMAAPGQGKDVFAAETSSSSPKKDSPNESEEERRKRLYKDIDFMSLLKSKKLKKE